MVAGATERYPMSTNENGNMPPPIPASTIHNHAPPAGATPIFSPSVAYGLFDGMFEQALIRHLVGVPTALDDLRTGANLLLPQLFAAARTH